MLTKINSSSTLTIPDLVRFVLLALFLSMLSSPAMAACICKPKETQTVGVCEVEIEVCGCVKKMEWEYSAEATEVITENTGNSSGEEHIHIAIEEAIRDLFRSNSGMTAMCFPV